MCLGGDSRGSHGDEVKFYGGVEAANVETMDEVELRHLEWLNRTDSVASGSQNWRPKKIHRLTTKHWFHNLDSQIQVSSARSGLSFYALDPSLPLWQDWRTWPNLIVPMDLASDNVCGTFAAQYHFHIAMEAMPDEGHGCDNDVNQTFQIIGNKPLVILLLISKNLVHGPMDDEGRAKMFMDYHMSLYKRFDPVTFPLFQAFNSPIRLGLAQQGIDFEPGIDGDYALWKFLYERACNGRIGAKTSLVRFCAVVDMCLAMTADWWNDAFETVYIAIEEELLKGVGMRKLIMKDAKSDQITEGGQPVAGPKLSYDRQFLKATTQNAIAMKAVDMSDRSTFRHVAQMGAGIAKVKAYHSEANRRRRAGAGNEDWLQEHVDGGFMRHVNKILGCISSRVTLSKANFVVDFFLARKLEEAEVTWMLKLNYGSYQLPLSPQPLTLTNPPPTHLLPPSCPSRPSRPRVATATFVPLARPVCPVRPVRRHRLICLKRVFYL